ncbi:MAG: hypothetical protein NWE95_09480 [Candidatus Bathyarchaeota archaeon]|nr:hypothetical protein [Candidatus Bathyarchaeota archaeon]
MVSINKQLRLLSGILLCIAIVITIYFSVNFYRSNQLSVNQSSPEPSSHPTLNLTVFSPENKTYESFHIPLNFTVSEQALGILYTIDGGKNITANNETITGLSYGTHTIKVTAYDDIGYATCREIFFTVASEKTETVIDYFKSKGFAIQDSPSNVSFSTAALDLGGKETLAYTAKQLKASVIYKLEIGEWIYLFVNNSYGDKFYIRFMG